MKQRNLLTTRCGEPWTQTVTSVQLNYSDRLPVPDVSSQMHLWIFSLKCLQFVAWNAFWIEKNPKGRSAEMNSKLIIIGILGIACSLNTDVQIRRSILLPWKCADAAASSKVLGWADEIRDQNLKTYQVRIGWDSEGIKDTLLVDLPYVEEPTGLASTLWPGGLAGAILCRCPSLRAFFSDSGVLELGCGLALAGLTAAADANSTHLTDNDDEILAMLQKIVDSRYAKEQSIVVKRLDWRENHDTDQKAKAILSMDVAYYYYLLRPLMDTVRAFMHPEKSLWLAVGQCNRESQWDLYHNVKDGCYNQLTDKREPPWPGLTQMLLYRLRMFKWQPYGDESAVVAIDGDIPVAALLYLTSELALDPLTEFDYASTENDEEGFIMSF